MRLEARGPNAEGEGAVTIRDLIKSALRMRPDRIVVGEVRGEETVDMISSAMLNGHSGSMSTGHANNPTDMLHRLETMMLMGIDLRYRQFKDKLHRHLILSFILEDFEIRQERFCRL